MAKRVATAILMCAVMALVAFVPLVAAGEYTIIKGPQGPRASAMTWTYETTDYGVWTAKLDNHGLRSLVVDVYDNTSGALDQVLHQRIRFAAYDAYPSGIIYSEPVNMAAGRVYEITATPNGPRDSYVVVSDQWMINELPVALFDATPNYLTVNVNASASYDTDGTIVEYIWEWGDSTMGSGEVTSHMYGMAGTYDVTLTVVDNLGGSDSLTQPVTVMAPPNELPVAMFTPTVNELVVDVNASASYDTDGTIVAYGWNWGDGSPSVVSASPRASHTYAMGGTYAITLVVTDNDGGIGSVAHDVMPWAAVDEPPVASFTAVVNGLTVSVNASGSSDDNGIVSYAWNWGDGTTGNGVVATHTYSGAKAQSLTTESRVSIQADPVPPYYVAGYTLDSTGAALPDCQLTISNMRTGMSVVIMSDALGFYMWDIANQLEGGYLVGDLINVTAVKGTAIGWNEGLAAAGGYIQLDVTLVAPPFDVTITLIVTDTKGQTSTMTMKVTLYP